MSKNKKKKRKAEKSASCKVKRRRCVDDLPAADYIISDSFLARVVRDLRKTQHFSEILEDIEDDVAIELIREVIVEDWFPTPIT